MEKNEDSLTLKALSIFGDMVRRHRQHSEWSTYKLSEKIGVPIATINAVEIGETWPVSTDREAIAYFFNLEVDTFDKILRTLRRQESQIEPNMAFGPNVISLENFRKENGKGLPHSGA